MKLRDLLITLYRKANTNRTFLMKEVKSPLHIKKRDKMKLNFDGFLGESKVLYNLLENDSKNYLSDHQRLRTRYINSPYSFILNEKIVFEAMYKECLPMPKSLAIIEDGLLLSLSNEKIESVPCLINYLKKHNKFIVKAMRNGAGNGFYIVSITNEQLFINNEQISKDFLEKWFKQLNGYFISEFVEQGDYGNELYEGSTNTIRVLTIIKPATNKAYIPVAVQRIGSHLTAPVDKWPQGGLSSNIDLKTGALGPAVNYPKDGNLVSYNYHPHTKYKIKGKTVPNWKKIKDDLIRAAEKFPYIKYIGWDIAITKGGYSVIEGNNFSDVNVLQVHKPLLTDETLKDFYKFHKIL